MGVACTRAAGILADRIPYTGEPFGLSGVTAVFQQRLGPRDVVGNPAWAAPLRPRNGAHFFRVLAHTSLYRAGCVMASNETSQQLARDLIRWSDFLAINPIEDAQFMLSASFARAHTSTCFDGLSLLDPDALGPPACAHERGRLRQMQRPPGLDVRALKVDWARRQAYVGRRQQMAMLTWAVGALLHGAGHRTALEAFLCGEAIKCELGCSLHTLPAELRHVLQQLGPEGLDVLQRLSAVLLPSEQNEGEQRGTAGVDATNDGEMRRDTRSACGCSSSAVASSCDSNADAEALVDERALSCLADQDVLTLGPANGSWEAACLAAGERCGCAEGGVLAACDQSSSCRQRLELATSALGPTAAAGAPLPSSQWRDGTWAEFLAAAYGELVEASPPPPSSTDARSVGTLRGMEVAAPGEEPFWLAYAAGDEETMIAEVQSEQDLRLAPPPADSSPQTGGTGSCPQPQAVPTVSAPPAQAASSDVAPTSPARPSSLVAPAAAASLLIGWPVLFLVCICSWRRGCDQGTRATSQRKQCKLVELEALMTHETGR